MINEILQRRGKNLFRANRKISKPVRVEFYTKEGERVAFKVHKQDIKPVKIKFMFKRV